MAMMLQEAIDRASVWAAPGTYGVKTFFTVSVHDNQDTVLVATSETESAFRPDLPLRNWGPATIDLSEVVGRRWFERPPVPGFSTRGQGGMTLNVEAGGGTPIPVDASVRRDPGLFNYLSFVGLGPSVQIEIEKLSGPGGTAISGVTLRAVEDGALLRAVGPSIRDPALTASYTLTIWVMPIIP